MRAVKGSLGHSPKERWRELERAALNARSGGLIRAISGQRKRASSEEASLVARCGLAREKARPWAKRLSWQTQGGRVKYPPGLGG